MAALGLILGILAGCRPEPLPILGESQTAAGRTVPHAIPDFAFIDQDSVVITNRTFSDKAYVAEFFFTACPSICPLVKKQLLRVYKTFEKDERLHLLSHTIDPKRDSVPRLKQYADNLGAANGRWHFVTGEKKELYAIADDYFSIAVEAPDAPGGYDHSGRLILVDRDRHVRSFCNGADSEEVDRFIQDIEKLLDEEY